MCYGMVLEAWVYTMDDVMKTHMVACLINCMIIILCATPAAIF